MLLVGGRVKSRTWGRRAPKRESATSEVEEREKGVGYHMDGTQLREWGGRGRDLP